MGHVRLGKMPASKKWKEVVQCLAEAEVDLGRLADSVAVATEDSLSGATKDPGFIEALWLLIRIPQAAKERGIAKSLRELGIVVPADSSIADVVAGLAASVETAQQRNPADATDFGEMAKHAAVAALHSSFQERLPALWDASAEDTRTTIASLSSPERFADLAQRFFSRLIDHNIQYFLTRETPRHIGPGSFARSVADLAVFDRAMRRHCDETSMIARTFARDWLGNNAYHRGKAISRKDVAGFGHIAFEKIRKELLVRRTDEHI